MTDPASWMAQLNGCVPLSKINLPGTHNSTARYIALPFWCKCQDMSIRGQLDCGVRYLDIRLELKKGRLRLVHSVIDCRSSPRPFSKLYADDVIEQLKDFLCANPTETVLLCVNRDDGADDKATFDAFYRSFVQPQRQLWFMHNRIPLLHECAGRLVLLRRTGIKENMPYDDFTAGLDVARAFEYPQTPGEPPYAHEARSRGNQPYGFFTAVQDSFNVPPRKKWEQCVLPALRHAKADENTLLINYLSANNGLNSPKKCARYVNTRFLQYAAAGGPINGITVFDYVTPELARAVADSNLA